MENTPRTGCTSAPTKLVSPVGNARLNVNSGREKMVRQSGLRVRGVGGSRRNVCLVRRGRGKGGERDVGCCPGLV